MKHFLLKLLLVIICFYGVLFLLQWIVDSGLRKTHNDDYAGWNLIFENQIKEPMVFLGSSRTEVHFDPQLIEKHTGIPCYNLGLSGTSLEFQKIRWRSYIAHSRPKIVIQNVDLFALSEKSLPDKRQFLPYYNKPEMFDELKKVDPTTRLEKWIPMSKYRGFETLVLKGIAAFFGKEYTGTKIKGYRKHQQSWNSDFEKFKKQLKGKPIDFSTTDFSKGLAELRQIITDCKKIDAQLILVWTPTYYELSELQQPTLSTMNQQISSMARENNVPLWDFTNDTINLDKKYFYNSFHMNDKGVAVFCRQFSDSLNVYLKKP